MGAAAVGGVFIWFFVMFIFFLIGIMIMRWAFRINDIIKRLDKIVESLNRGDIKMIFVGLVCSSLLLAGCTTVSPNAKYLHVVNPTTNEISFQFSLMNGEMCKATRDSMLEECNLRNAGRCGEFASYLKCREQSLSSVMPYESLLKVSDSGASYEMRLEALHFTDCNSFTQSNNDNRVSVIKECTAK